MPSPASVDAVVVLAAGEGKRMHSATPKVLHQICGRTLIGHVLEAAAPLNATRTLVVIGHGRDQVAAALSNAAVTTVVQAEQRGTGHAVRLALDAAPDVEGNVLVVYGDLPLLTTGALANLVASGPTSMLTAPFADPTGYGRVIRGASGAVQKIVEHRDATDEQQGINEVNAGVYLFDAHQLRATLAKLGTDNAQGEEYLTDVVGLLLDAGERVAAIEVSEDDVTGVNDRGQLAAAASRLNHRILTAMMRNGTTIIDPTTTWVDATATVEADATIAPYTRLLGATRVAPGATVGPHAELVDTVVGEGATIRMATCEGAEVGPEATVGPYTFLRPGTRLGRKAKAGGFVEMKATTVGDGTKVPHLSYIGDAEIGARTNIGAGTITCNWDGVTKHRTTIGDDVFVGSNNTLVPPLEIGDAAYTAAGSTINKNVPEDALSFGRARQVTKEGRGRRRTIAAQQSDPGGDDE